MVLKIFLLLCDCLVPVIMIVVGRWLWKHTPKEINDLLGYRTTRSMKNINTWNFANKYGGKLWWKFGWIVLLLSIIAHIPFMKSSDNWFGILSLMVVITQTVVLLLTIIPVEKALKNKFDDNGLER